LRREHHACGHPIPSGTMIETYLRCWSI
jgi:hypothetical protein